MTENAFRALGVEEAVSVIRTWAELPWPVTREQALEQRDRLNWTGAADDERIFTTNYGFGAEDGGFSMPFGELSSMEFQLTTTAPRGAEAEVAEQSWSAFNSYKDAMSKLWGTPNETRNRRVTTAQWTLPNGAWVSLSGADRLVMVSITSPATREDALLADEA